MRGEFRILAVFCLSTVTAEIVYLEDITGDHDKRDLRHDLPETMQFRLKRSANEVPLNLRKNNHLNHNAPIYESVKDDNGNHRIVRNSKIKPAHNFGYYQNLDTGAYVRAECVKRETGPCARHLTGNLFVNGKEHTLEPAVNELYTRELDSYPGTPHQLNLLKLPEAFLAASRFDREVRGYKTHESVRLSAEASDIAEQINDAFTGKTLTRNKREAPVRHGFEVLLAIDHTVYENFEDLHPNNDNDTIKYRIREYFCHVMNGVDIRFASIQHPSIYVTIVGFFISTNNEDSPWLDYTEYYTFANYGLSAMVQWRNNDGLPAHDHAALLIRTDLAIMVNGRLKTTTMGLAHMQSVCFPYRVSVNEEHGLFLGAQILAHEFAHCLGASHDGDVTYASNCSANDNYVMSTTHNDFVETINEWRFSSCSASSILTTFSLLGNNDCTLNEAVVYDEAEFNAFLVQMADERYSLDVQCKLIVGPHSYFCGTNNYTASICRDFKCQGDYHCENHGVVDGTPCGNDKICYEGTCQNPDVCRYRPMGSPDIAKDYQEVSQSSENDSDPRPAALALDGSLETFSLTGGEDNPWWKVKFSYLASVFAVKIWNRGDCCGGNLGNLEIKVNGTLCGQLTGPLPTSSCFEVTCSNGPIQGSTLEIKQNKLGVPLNIAEVQVFEAVCEIQESYVNIAISEMYTTVTQSSTDGNHTALLAADSDHSTYSSTQEQLNPFWQIDFCRNVTIGRVKIWIVDTVPFLLLQLHVDSALLGYIGGPAYAGGVKSMAATAKTGTTLRIRRAEDSVKVLKLADVEIFDI